MTDRDREVLYVSYFFPPLGGVSVPRVVAFTRYLPESGWRPVVLAPRGAAYGLRDPAGLASLPPGLEVIRASSPEPHALRRRAEPLLRPARAMRSALGRGGTAPVSAEDAARVVAGSHAGRLAGVRRLLFFPDDQLGWVPFASRAGIAHARRRRPDVIYSSAFPISAHLVAGAIHRATGIPWVAEFRDPWVDNAIAPELPTMHRRLQRRIERWIVARAARTVLVTPGLTAMFAARYPSRAGRMRTIMNGYDPAELATAHPAAAPDQPDHLLRLVYTGTLYRPAEMSAFLIGLERFVAETPEARARLRVELIGYRSPEFDAAAAPYLAEDRLGGVLDLIDFMPRAEALERLGEATAALVTMGGGPGMGLFVSGKLFDYIGLDRPVFAMAPPGDLRGVLEQLDWGIGVDPDPESVTAGLRRLWAGDYRRGRADPEGRFNRRALAADLASVLDEVVETT